MTLTGHKASRYQIKRVAGGWDVIDTAYPVGSMMWRRSQQPYAKKTDAMRRAADLERQLTEHNNTPIQAGRLATQRYTA